MLQYHCMAEHKKKPINLKVILVISGIVLVIGFFYAWQVIIPKLIGSFVGSILTTSLPSALNNLDFSKAEKMSINQDLSQNEGMYLQVVLNKGKLTINNNTSINDKLTGEIKYLGKQPVIKYETDKDKLALYTINSSEQAGEDVALHLSQKTNGRVDVAMGAGAVDINLKNLDIPFLNVAAGAGSLKVTFADKSSEANLAAGTGVIEVNIPSNMEHRITFSQGLGSENLRTGKDYYIKTDKGYETKGFEKAENKIDLTIGQGVGGVTINSY